MVLRNFCQASAKKISDKRHKYRIKIVVTIDIVET